MSERSHEEIRQLLEKITQNNLYVTRWKTGGGSLSFGFIAPVVIADFFRKEDCDFYLAAPDIVRQLLSENERLKADILARDEKDAAFERQAQELDRLRAVNERLVAAAEAAAQDLASAAECAAMPKDVRLINERVTALQEAIAEARAGASERRDLPAETSSNVSGVQREGGS